MLIYIQRVVIIIIYTYIFRFSSLPHAHLIIDMTGMRKRYVGFNSLLDVKRQSYLAHGRRILGYCSLMWSLSNSKTTKLERVQRQAPKFILNDVSPYHERCTHRYLSCLCASLEKQSSCVFCTASFMVNYVVITLIILS